MDNDTHKKLLEVDDADHAQFPPFFNHARSLVDVMNLKPEIEKICGKECYLTAEVQDATYFASMSFLHHVSIPFPHDETELGIIFSCFGNLVTVVNNNSCQTHNAAVSRIIDTLRVHNFTHVDRGSLGEPYDGPNKGFRHSTWFHRYFDEL